MRSNDWCVIFGDTNTSHLDSASGGAVNFSMKVPLRAAEQLERAVSLKYVEYYKVQGARC